MKAAETSHHFFKSLDGTELHYLRVMPEKKRGVLLLIHGLAEHSGRYRFFCDYFAKQGWAIYLLDQRGHGHSPGLRGHVDRLEDLVDDLAEFVNHVASQEREQALFLVAHSFGGQIAVNYLARKTKVLCGAVLSSPNLRLAMKISLLKRLFAHALVRCLPTLQLPNDVDAGLLSHDPQIARDYLEDPLVGHKITLKMGTEILNNLKDVMSLAPQIKTPCF
ncbi:MAG TPA: alpha/beta hydrolase, partial [Deltaproteobacteria bacterium]|nr:alpha/beta hydrolase [Deltaproteobacteria bacterium]